MSAGAAPGSARIGGRRRREAADDFRLMADSAPVMIWVADPEGRAVYFNRPWLEFTGRTHVNEVGLGWAAGLHADDREATVARYLDAIHRREPFELEYRLLRHDGEPRWLLARGVPVERDGRLQGFVGSCLDITDRRVAEEAARKRHARAHEQSATLARDQFLSILSHELRTPLNSIKTWAHFLEQQLRGGDPSIRRAVDGVMIGVEQQARLIEDLLDLTRALSGQLGLIKHPVALLPLIADAVEDYRKAAEERGIALLTRYDVGGAEVHADAARLRQVFCNLVANAVKFTPAGGTISVDARVDESEACIQVRDDGSGIAPEFLPHVFDPFRQADQGSSRRVQQGVGLGLALVQRLAELHGGHVTCESGGVGRGSTFRVFLPLRRETGARPALTPTHAAPTNMPSLDGIHVLLIDDQREARESLVAVLAQAGAHVRAAGSAREAMGLLAASPGEGPEVVVCDIAMPEEDGYAALKRIREWEAAQPSSPRRPAVAISAYGEREDRLRALTEGFQTHLSKPISPAELMLVISNAARAARA